MWCEITLANHDMMFVGNCYRSPNSIRANNEKLLLTLKKIEETRRFTHILVKGDYNYPDIDCASSTTTCDGDSEAAKFLDRTQYCLESGLRDHEL